MVVSCLEGKWVRGGDGAFDGGREDGKDNDGHEREQEEAG